VTTVFDAAIDTLFADPNLATDATYTPAAGVGIAVRVILSRAPVDSFDVGRSGVRLAPPDQTRAFVADVRKSDVPQPRKGDSVVVAARVYPITAEPELGENLLTWHLTLGAPS
jgi:hypothetical protein